MTNPLSVESYCKYCECERQHYLHDIKVTAYQLAVDTLNATKTYLATCVICGTAFVCVVDVVKKE